MAIKPILFNSEMVRAILDGRKSCTRRLPRKQIEEKYLEYDEWVQAVAANLGILEKKRESNGKPEEYIADNPKRGIRKALGSGGAVPYCGGAQKGR